MKGLIIRAVSGSLRFAIYFIAWFVLPKLIADALQLKWLNVELLFYMALLISLLAGLSGFYEGRSAGIVFSMAADASLLAYLIYFSGGGRLSVDVLGLHVKMNLTNLLIVLSLPIVMSLVGKVWKLATLEAERRVEMVEEG